MVRLFGVDLEREVELSLFGVDQDRQTQLLAGPPDEDEEMRAWFSIYDSYPQDMDFLCAIIFDKVYEEWEIAWGDYECDVSELDERYLIIEGLDLVQVRYVQMALQNHYSNHKKFFIKKMREFARNKAVIAKDLKDNHPEQLDPEVYDFPWPDWSGIDEAFIQYTNQNEK